MVAFLLDCLLFPTTPRKKQLSCASAITDLELSGDGLSGHLKSSSVQRHLTEAVRTKGVGMS